jgi:hypothetical protein
MLFTREVLEGIAEGRVTLAFRRWRRRPPRRGATVRTPVGVIAIEGVTAIDEGDITGADLRRCGMSAESLRASLTGDGTLLRIELRLVGADPRVALRDTRPSEADLSVVAARLARLDRGPVPWTARYLRVIADHPAVVSRELAGLVGADVPPFKRRVRLLKELGLTESLDVGYRLSVRGYAVLTSLESDTR